MIQAKLNDANGFCSQIALIPVESVRKSLRASSLSFAVLLTGCMESGPECGDAEILKLLHEQIVQVFGSLPFGALINAKQFSIEDIVTASHDGRSTICRATIVLRQADGSSPQALSRFSYRAELTDAGKLLVTDAK